MTLEKAIEILSWRGDEGNLCIDQDFYDALKLGIEALKWLTDWRNTNSFISNVRLPSESET